MASKTGCAKRALLNGVYFTIPFAITGGVLVSVSYLIDSFSGGNAIYGLGSTNPIAVIFKSVGTLVFSLMLPVLSGITALCFSGKEAFIAGIAGGYITQNGSTLALPYGDTSAVSGIFGAIGAGLLAGIIVKILKRIIRPQSEALKRIKTIFLIPIASTLTVSVTMMLLNPLIALLNTGITLILSVLSKSNPVMFGALIGILMSIDFGGALSKATFIFASAAIATGEYTAMAAVMCAGMAVPLSIALSATIFTNKFAKKERQLAKANYLFGLCFITEGVIPIVAKSPARVIPCCALSGAVSGGMCAGFGCTLIAPFGGILLIPIIGNPLLFLIALFTGTITGATVLGIVKKAPEIKFSRALSA